MPHYRYMSTSRMNTEISMPTNRYKFLNTRLLLKLAILIVVTFNGVFLSGCSLLKLYEEQEQEQEQQQEQSEIELQMERYDKMEPEIQRILSLESDMQLIVAELGKYSSLGTDPLGSVESENSELANSSTDSTIMDNIAVDSPCVKNGTKLTGHCIYKIGIHIAGFKDKKYVPPGWLFFKKRLPISLSQGMQPLMTPVVINNTVYQSLRIGPFRSVIQAKRMCDESRHIIQCSVTEYKGQEVIF
jgi:hypothetical protein